jgi:DNA-binding beta-propeller fold protein YncE
LPRTHFLLASALGTVLVAGAVIAPVASRDGPVSTSGASAAVAVPARLSGEGDSVDLPLAAERISDAIAAVLATALRTADDLVADAASAPEGDPKLSRKERRQQRREAKPSDRRRLSLVQTITGGVAPKSIVSAQNGKIFAMNMMYGHSITVFNRRYKRIKVIDDSVNLSDFGYRQYDREVRGAPVEAALDLERKRMYVSNYSMYGPGFRQPGFDLCTDSDPIDPGFVYAINTRTLRKVDVFKVGRVPKYLAVTPDSRYLLVGNWCSWDISVVDLEAGREVRRIDAGVAPRGIAFSPNGRTAYVTLVGEDRLLVIDLRSFRVRRDITAVGERPRHLVMSRDGRYLYITAQGDDRKRKVDGRILRYDTRKRKVVAHSEPLVEPRTTISSEDGRSLYVVDYYPGTLVKLRARDLRVLQTVYLGHHPIGVTYDDASDKLWVAGYGGNVWVLKDR